MPNDAPTDTAAAISPTVDALCDAMWEGRFDMPEELNPRPWARLVVPGVLEALGAAGYEVVRRG